MLVRSDAAGVPSETLCESKASSCELGPNRALAPRIHEEWSISCSTRFRVPPLDRRFPWYRDHA